MVEQHEGQRASETSRRPGLLVKARLASQLLRPRQRWMLVVLTVLRTSVGVCDFVFAGAMFQLFTLLQGGGASPRFWWLPKTVISACIVTGIFVVMRLLLDLVATRQTVHHIQNLYADLLLRLARGYGEMRWNKFLQQNRSEMLKHAMHTALDAAYFYQLIVEGIAGLLVSLLLTVALGSKSPLMILGLGLIGCVLFGLNRFILRERLAVSGSDREQSGRLLQRTFSEALSAGKELRTYRNHAYFEDVLQIQAARLGRSNVQLALLPQVSRLVTEQGVVLLFLATIVVVQLRGGDVRQLLSLLVFYFVLSRRLLPAFSQLALSAGQIQGAYENFSVIDAELRTCERHRSPVQNVSPPYPGNVLELHGVSFAFQDGRRILRDADFHVAVGEIVALQGASGVGKSSVLNLAAGLLEPSTGSVCLDRTRLAYVPQEITLFDDSIRNNLVFGNASKSDAVLWHALDVVNLAGHVADLPQGLDTPIGDGGLLLSGGQRQRLGLARALLQDASLLLLDEATSAIDEENEVGILGKLAKLDISVLMVSHRPGSAGLAHRTYALQDCLLIEVPQEDISATLA